MHSPGFTLTSIALKIHRVRKKQKRPHLTTLELVESIQGFSKSMQHSKACTKEPWAVLKHKDDIFSSTCSHRICPLNRLPEMGDRHSPGSKSWSHMRLRKSLSYCHQVHVSGGRKLRPVTGQGEPDSQGKLRTMHPPVPLASNPFSSQSNTLL